MASGRQIQGTQADRINPRPERRPGHGGRRSRALPFSDAVVVPLYQTRLARGARMPRERYLSGRFRLPVGWIFISPGMLFVVAFMGYPVCDLIWLSFRDYSPLRSAGTPWVGLQNYVRCVRRL